MKSVIIYSGGLDSTCLLMELVKMHGSENVFALNFNYGSKHNVWERQAAQGICKELGVNLKLVDMLFISDLLKSDLLQSGGAIPEGHYTAENMKSTVVPFRNGIMLSIAAGYAESIDAQQLLIANHAGDHAVYPDCRQEFIDPMTEAILAGTAAGLDLVAPYTDMTKAEVLGEGASIGAPIDKTWSCYQPKVSQHFGDKRDWAIHCGKCGTCVERIEAFILAGVEDKTEYADKNFALNLLREKGSIE